MRWNRMVPNFLPAGKISSLEIVGDDSIRINLSVFADDYQLNADMVISGSRLLIPIIRYCLECNVWLPPQGVKSIEIMEDGVALCVAIDTDKDSGLGEPMRLSRHATA